MSGMPFAGEAILQQVEGVALHAEPARDYRKELWIGALVAAMGLTNVERGGHPAQDHADAALELFDERFPK